MVLKQRTTSAYNNGVAKKEIIFFDPLAVLIQIRTTVYTRNAKKTALILVIMELFRRKINSKIKYV